LVRRRIAGFAAAVLLVGAAAVACAEPPPLRIGAVYPLDGSQGPGGVEEYRGVRLAAAFANDAGGVAGRRVVVQPVNVPSSDAATAAVAGLHASGVRFVVGSYGSTISAPAAEAAASRGMLFWETGAVGEMAGRSSGRLVFRVPATGAVLGRAAIDFMVDEVAARLRRAPEDLRFAIANVDDVYGRSVAEGAVAAIRARGLRLVGRYPYDVRDPEMSAIVDAIAADRPDILFVSSYLSDGVELRRRIVRADVPLLGNIGTSSSYCHPEFGALLGGDAVGLFASDKPDAGALDPAGLLPAARSLLARAASAYRERYDEEMTAPALAGFSAAWALFREVLPEATSLTPAAAAAAARAVEIPRGGLPNGSGLAFAPPGAPDAGANRLAATVIWEWVAPGERTVVWPPAYATRAPRVVPISP
jgi:branched-chain amino acid transport system substrate-binding protein